MPTYYAVFRLPYPCASMVRKVRLIRGVWILLLFIMACRQWVWVLPRMTMSCPMLQHEFAFFLRLFVFEREFPRRAEADGCDNGVFAQAGFVVRYATPCPGCRRRSVEQAGVEAGGLTAASCCSTCCLMSANTLSHGCAVRVAPE